MRDISQWTEADLIELIRNKVQESIELDYKACASLQKTDKKKTEISKDVSAMANSAGGILIYGVIENGHIPVEIDEGFDPSEISKEWLEQIISSRIQRKIENIMIKPIYLETTNPGKVAYVVYVPQSSRAPHQAHDKRFYKRYNFESAPMEEYEIRDVSNRDKGPKLILNFGIENLESIFREINEGQKTYLTAEIIPLIENTSPAPAEYIAINIFIDSDVNSLLKTGGITKKENQFLLIDGEYKNFYMLALNHSIPAKIPIFKGTKFRLINSPICIELERDKKYVLAYKLLAPHMEEARGAFTIRAGKKGIQIEEINLNKLEIGIPVI
ncbi:ATP-binding protein [Aurantivibrio infirmus]